MSATRPYTLRVSWPGKEEVWLGSVDFHVRLGAPEHEVEAASKAALEAFCARYLPDGVPMPAVSSVVMGHFVFISGDDA